MRARRAPRAASDELLLRALAGAAPSARADLRGAVAVVLPARNESQALPGVLAALPARIDDRPVHALVIDDGSSDGTGDVARAGGARTLRLDAGRGQGLALRTGYRLALESGAAMVVAMDADGQHSADDLAALVVPVLRGEADLVCGSRRLGTAPGMGCLRHLGMPALAALVSLAARRRVTDPVCGYRAVGAGALARLTLRRDQFHNAELLVEAARRRLRVREVPVTIHPRAAGVSSKPPTAQYLLAFLAVLVRTRLRREPRG